MNSKPWLVTALAASILLGGCAPSKSPEEIAANNPASANVEPSKIYPVTPDMEKGAGEFGGKPAPDFKATDISGKDQTLKDVLAGGPAMLFFIVRDCPCCVKVGPFVEKIRKAYEGKLRVVGVIDVDVADAKKWAEANQVKYDVLADPKLDIIKAYHVPRGVYMALIGKDGVVNKIYPGYSQDILNEMSQRIAGLANVPTVDIDVSEAPTRPTSGCTFALSA